MQRLFLILLLCGPLLAAQDLDIDLLPDLGELNGWDDNPIAGTFTGSTTKTTTTRDKGLGFGRKNTQRAEGNERLQEAREAAKERTPETTPAETGDGYDEAVGMGYHYLDEEDPETALRYLDAAERTVDYGDLDAVLGLYALYNVLAGEALADGRDELADSAFLRGVAVADTFLEGDPNPDDAYEMHLELGYSYYELDLDHLAAYHFDAALDIYPDDAYTAYMAASCLAISGDDDMAVAYLAYALALGVLDDAEVAPGTDADLDGLRNHPEYRELAEEYGF